jgi:hypothetical protein
MTIITHTQRAQLAHLILLLCLLTAPLTGQTMHISQQGHGQFVLLPYYTVRNGLNTLVSIDNHTDQAKAIKVRINEGNLGFSVLDFNLYLGPYDSWGMGLVATTSTIPGHEGEASGHVMFNDGSCTPYLISGQEFQPHQYETMEVLADGFDAASVQNMQRTQEGFIEIYEMGSLDPASTQGQAVTGQACDVIEANWSLTDPENNWVQDAEMDMLSASGGLSASVTLIDVAAGTAYAYESLAIDQFFTADSIVHTQPGDQHPNPMDGVPHMQLLGADGMTEALWEHGLDALSALITYQKLATDYDLSEGLGAQHDLVLSFPTRGYYQQLMVSNSPFDLNETGNQLNVCRDVGHGHDNYYGSIIDPGGDLTSIRTCGGSAIDTGCPLQPPTIVSHPTFCATVNVLSFFDQNSDFDSNSLRDPSPLLGSVNNLFWPTNHIQGRFLLNFENQIVERSRTSLPSDDFTAMDFHGLPVMGLSFQTYFNGNAQPGLLAQYGLTQTPTYLKKIVSANVD